MKPTAYATAAALILLVPARTAFAQTPNGTPNQTPTPDLARQIEGQLRTWIGTMVGPGLKIGERPVQVMAEGDHYRLNVPFTIQNAGKADTITPTATMHPLDGGRWSIDSMTVPQPLRFTVMMPQPPREGQKVTPAPVPVSYVMTVATQMGRGVWDPTYKTASTLETDMTGFNLNATGTNIRQQSTFDHSHAMNSFTPASGDRVDVVTDGLIENYANTSQSPGTQELKLASRAIKVSGTMHGVSRDNATLALQQMIRIFTPIIAAAPAKPGAPPPAPDMKATRTLIAAMGDLASDMALIETVDDLKVSYAGAGGTAKQALLGMGGKSVNGILQAYMDIGFDGIAVPDLPLGPMEALVPTRVALRPVISGAATQDVIDALLAATEQKAGQPTPEAFGKVFSKGGVSTGLDSFLIEMGGAVIKGNGAFVMSNPQTGTGKAQITATGFDALQAKASVIPQLAQIMPLFVFLKGLGKASGDQLLWDVTYEGGKMLVNGTDMSAMMGR